MEKLEFNLGDTAYIIDDDFNYFEEQVRIIELNRDGSIEYSTWDCDFTEEDIGTWVFTSETLRELHMEVLAGCKIKSVFY